jgi:hypothetical protein
MESNRPLRNCFVERQGKVNLLRYALVNQLRIISEAEPVVIVRIANQCPGLATRGTLELWGRS